MGELTDGEKVKFCTSSRLAATDFKPSQDPSPSMDGCGPNASIHGTRKASEKAIAAKYKG